MNKYFFKELPTNKKRKCCFKEINNNNKIETKSLIQANLIKGSNVSFIREKSQSYLDFGQVINVS